MNVSRRDAVTPAEVDLARAREEERLHLARELHDELGQKLAAIKMAVMRLVPALQATEQQAGVRHLLILIDDTVEAMRGMTRRWRPLILDDLGLGAAIEALVDDARRDLGIPVFLDMDPGLEQWRDASALAIYRIVQEALTNVARHAQASRVAVDIIRQGPGLLLRVQDDGIGIDGKLGAGSELAEGSQGCLGILERTRMLGGRLELGRGHRWGGAQVSVHLPWHHRSRPSSGDSHD